MLTKLFAFLVISYSVFDTVKAATCTVPSHGNVNVSDTPAILSAFKRCGNGGVIRFPEGKTYSLGELTILEECKNCEVILDGTIRLSDNLEYWNSSTSTTVKFAFQDSYAAFIVKGWKNGHIHSPKGTGVVDGAGQRWWNAHFGHDTIDPAVLRRPVLFTVWQSTDVTISNIHFKDSPMWNNFVIESKGVTYQNVKISAKSTSTDRPVNTDGWDTYRSEKIRILDANVVVGDDCFSFKPNSTDIIIKNVYCEGTHGVSVGSLAQYKGTYDIVKDAFVQNITFVGGTNAFRIKTWAGDVGSALVQNIHYQGLKVNGVNEAITVDACYMTSADVCTTSPTKVDLVNITVSNLTGTTAKSRVANVVCVGENCDVTFKGIDLKPADGSPAVFQCKGVTSASGLPCNA